MNANTLNESHRAVLLTAAAVLVVAAGRTQGERT